MAPLGRGQKREIVTVTAFMVAIVVLPSTAKATLAGLHFISLFDLPCLVWWVGSGVTLKSDWARWR